MEFGVKERVLIVLCDDMKAETCAEEVASMTGLPATEVQVFINQALQEGYLVLTDIAPPGEEPDESYYYTNKVAKNMIDEDARAVAQGLFSGDMLTAAEHAVKKKLGTLSEDEA